ncbi:MAG: hypothetical protein HXX12_16635 [Geothrix sp.]|uniref:hypothetical protein n=1 Tax=Geothrix sp. TaxID=1962974 RepID=UPI0017D0BC98|nr:hypothetical protein [Geothrix sp.]NWJ42591.1 hypothetical protein [Geothrix sp.]WIL19451.1 MAG: hypothetical protein QOZ81_001968 [Geothrix sp.]
MTALAGEDNFKFMHSERIGALRIGMPRKDVLHVLAGTPVSGPIELWEADGNYYQLLDFQSLGVKIYLVSPSKSGAQIIASIRITSPCTLATKRGIHLGSSEQDVIKLYKSQQNKEDSELGTSFVAGSVYGGLIFQFSKGKVSQIFLGPASE